MRFQCRRQLLGQSLVHSAVEIETDIEPDRLDILKSLNGRFQSVRGVKPAELGHE